VPPRISQTGNPPREPVSVERTLAVQGDELVLEQTFRMERQTEKIAPAVRVALRAGESVAVKVGKRWKNLAKNRDGSEPSLSLSGTMAGNEPIQIGIEGVIFHIELPKDRKEGVSVRLDHKNAVRRF
jgi:hypothetical protein